MHLGPHLDAHHSHPSGMTLGRIFLLAIGLNILIVVFEAVVGWLAGSMALVADAGHNLSDVLGLVLAGGAEWLRRGNASGRWTYGKRAVTIIAAQLNGLFLIVAIVGIALESTRRLFAPGEISGETVIGVALVAVGLNVATAWLLRGHRDDLNVYASYLHMVADAAVSVAVVIGGILVAATGWTWIDPALGLGICAVLSVSTWRLLWQSTAMMMHAAPNGEDVERIRDLFVAQPEVRDVLDLHVWNVSTTDVLLSARLLCQSLPCEQQDALLRRLRELLESRFHIRHATIEIVYSEDTCTACRLDSSHPADSSDNRVEDKGASLTASRPE